MLRSSLLINLLGQVVATAVALITVPVFSVYFGVERYGCYLFLLAILPYFGLSDAALSRIAMVQTASGAARKHGDGRVVAPAWLGLIAGSVYISLFFLIYPLLSDQFSGDPAVAREVEAARLPSIALIALTTWTSIQIGEIEGRSRFALSNVIQIVGTLAGVIIPVLPGIYDGTFDRLVLGVVFGKLVQGLVAAPFSGRRSATSSDLSNRAGSRSFFSELGWLTLTTGGAIISATIDRILLGFSFGAGQLYYYAVPTSAALRLTVVAGAMGRALAPAFATAEKDRALRLTALGTDVLLIVLGLLVLALSSVGHDLLALWIDQDFADRATLLFRLSLVAMLGLSLAQIPGMLLQTTSRASSIVKLQAFELIPYVAAVFIGSHFGLVVVTAIMLVRQVSIGVGHMYLAGQSRRQMVDTLLLFGYHILAIVVFQALDQTSLIFRLLGFGGAAAGLLAVAFLRFREPMTMIISFAKDLLGRARQRRAGLPRPVSK